MLCFKKIDAFLINSSLNSALLKHQYPRVLMIERMCGTWLVISKKKSNKDLLVVIDVRAEHLITDTLKRTNIDIKYVHDNNPICSYLLSAYVSFSPPVDDSLTDIDDDDDDTSLSKV